MSGFAIPRHENRLPALIVAAAAHLGLLALLVFVVPSTASMLPIGSSVPINIVSSQPYTDTRPAEQAPVTAPAAAPQPQPQAPPQPPAAEVAPTPSFSHVPTAAPKTAKPVATQPSLHPTQPANANVDWNRMQQIIDNAKRNAGAQASGAAKGPPRVETAPQARPDAGQGISMSDQLGLQQLLERLWNPNCDAPGGSAVRLTAHFTVTLTGHLIPKLTLAASGRLVTVNLPRYAGDESALVNLEPLGDAVVVAAAHRALDAILEAEPFGQPYYGQAITVNFDAKEACSKR